MQTERLTELAKGVDPSRLVSGASGWHDKPVGDIIDMHIYLGPGHLCSSLLNCYGHVVVVVITEGKRNAMSSTNMNIGGRGGGGRQPVETREPFPTCDTHDVINVQTEGNTHQFGTISS